MDEWMQMLKDEVEKFRKKGWDVCIIGPEAEASPFLKLDGLITVKPSKLLKTLDKIYTTFDSEVLMIFIPWSRTRVGIFVVERKTGFPLRVE